MKSEECWTIAKVLEWTRGYFESQSNPSSRLDAELLLAHTLNVERIALYLDHHKPMSSSELAKMRGLVKRRAKGEPIHYILGHREFWSMTLAVKPGVLIPRPDTEILVEVALKTLDDPDGSYQIADIGCGSGAIGLAIGSERKESTVLCTDLNPDALQLAKENANKCGLGNIEFQQSNLLGQVEGDFDLIVSNPPYIRTEEIQHLMSDVRDFEPLMALDGGPDGLTFYRRLIRESSAHLRTGGFLALEIGYDQKEAVKSLFDESKELEFVSSHKDLAGCDRVILGKLSAL